MREQWLVMEHYRLHSVEEWPDGPHKEGELAAIRSAISSLSNGQSNPAVCLICQSRKRTLAAIVRPQPVRIDTVAA